MPAPIISSRVRTLAISTLSIAGLLLAGCVSDPTTLGSGGGDGTGSPSGTGNGTATGTGTGNGTGTGTGSTGSGGEAPQPASFELSIDQASSTIELRDSVELTVSIAANGYVGPVALSIVNPSLEVAAGLSSPTVTLAGSGTETFTVTLSSASDSVTGNYDFSVVGSVPTGDKSTMGDVTVEPAITLYVPVDVALMDPSTNAFGDYPTMIKALPNMGAGNTITVRFFNQDVIPHRIHASNPDQGFAHGMLDIAPNSFDPLVRNVSATGTYNFYPHDLGPGIAGRIVIQ